MGTPEETIQKAPTPPTIDERLEATDDAVRAYQDLLRAQSAFRAAAARARVLNQEAAEHEAVAA